VVPKTSNVPGEVILNGCTDNICSFDYSPSFTFFAAGSTYNMEIGGTVLLQLGNTNRLLRRRATTTENTESSDDQTLVQFKVEFVLTPPVDNLAIQEKDRGMSMLGLIMGMVVLACALALALAIWARRRLVSVKAVDPSYNTVMDNDANGRKRKMAREIQVDAEHGGSSSIHDDDNNNGQPAVIDNNVEYDHKCRVPGDGEGESHGDSDEDHCDPDRLDVSEHVQVVDEASTLSDIEIPM
jgi:hypothetical protein